MWTESHTKKLPYAYDALLLRRNEEASHESSLVLDTDSYRILKQCNRICLLSFAAIEEKDLEVCGTIHRNFYFNTIAWEYLAIVGLS